MSTTVEEIEIINTGAIQKLRIPLRDGGGVTVLRGRNGSGKSTALKAVERLCTGNSSLGLSARDGAARGEVAGLGVKLRVSRSITRSGELEVESLEGRLSVAELVDPGLKDQSAADSRRIKALIQLSGVKADPALFYELAGGAETFGLLTATSDLRTDDIVELGGRVKRAFEAASRSYEGKQQLAERDAAACQTSADGVDTSVVTDEAELRDRHANAVRLHQDLTTRMNQHLSQRETLLTAEQNIRDLKASYNGPTSDEAKGAVDKHRDMTRDAEAKVAELREALQLATSQLQLRQQEESAAHAELRAAQTYEANLRSWEDTIASMAEIASPPLPEDISAAAQAVESASQAISRAAVARRAIEELQKRDSHKARAKEYEAQALRYRDAAQAVDDVLSQQIAKVEGCPLRVQGGRLVTDTSRGETLYAELSDGERWRIAIEIAIAAVGENGLIQIPQEAWEGLDPINRQAIAKQVNGRRRWIITAEASADEAIVAEAI